jgi:small subunit ribosomal protein S2
MEATIDTLFSAGAHFGYPRARRHPSAAPFIFATKDQTDMFDLEETAKRLDAAKEFLASVARAGGQIVFVSGKNESLEVIEQAAQRVGSPYVAGRWIGGTLTNFKNIRKRIDRLEKLMAERESGALDKYTKRERLLIDREIDELTARFGGLVSLQKEPAVLVVVDTRHEDTAVREANALHIPVVGLSSSDCDFSMIQYPIPAMTPP